MIIPFQRFFRSGGGNSGKGPGRAAWLAVGLVALLWLTPGCPAPPGNQDLKKEVEALKAEVAGLKEKIVQMESAQKVLLELAKGAAPPKAEEPKAEQLPLAQPGQPAQPSAAAAMTVDELFKNQDALLGTRVTVKGVPGPVLMHKKTLFLSGPGGMVEVIYGNLQDKTQVDRLTAQALETPITVSGLLSAAPGQAKKAMRLIIVADAVEF
jgi:hypothetical protein